MQIYYIVRPKQNLVLGMDLLWKKPSECTETDLGLVLGLELKDALNVAAWVSFDGITAIPYSETTASSLFEKNLGKEYSLKRKIFCMTISLKLSVKEFSRNPFSVNRSTKQRRNFFLATGR